MEKVKKHVDTRSASHQKDGDQFAPQAPLIDTGDGLSVADYTVYAKHVVERRQSHEAQAGRDIRPTIGRDSTIDGGVYEGAYGGEAIVVDTEKYPAINAAYEQVLRKITSPEGMVDKNLALGAVFAHVRDHMRYDKNTVEQIFQRTGKGIDGSKIALDAYIANGAGVCRHQALFAGALLEKLTRDGILSGKASVDRNMIKRDVDDKYDGHAWVRYTNSRGTVFILDVAQNRIGTLDEFMAARRDGDKRVWDYGRTEDHDKLRAKMALQAMEHQQQWAPRDEHQQRGGSSQEHDSILEYDENGLIKMPDWIRKGNARTSTSQQAQEHNYQDSIARQPQKTPEQEAADKFWAAHDVAMKEVQGAIERAGHFDPCSAALSAGSRVGEITRVPGLKPDMVAYLEGIRSLCQEVGASGRDARSRFHRNPRSGLAAIYQMLAAIQR